ncbi:MAG: pyrrolo-quinoline quinone [Candidatus Korobacteraceae bacterium]
MARRKPSMLLVAAVAGVVLFFSACGKGGSSSSSTTTTPTPETLTSPVPTVTLTASSQSIVAGQSATLTWTSTDATSVTIEPTVGPQGPNSTQPFSVNPTTTTTYTATATGSGGISPSVSVTVTVTPVQQPPPPPAVAVYTHKYDNTRQGANVSETILTPTNVTSTTFGKLFTLNVDGYIFGQPLYVPNLTIKGAVHNVVYVATEHDSVYAFDADSSNNTAPLWKVSFLVNGATTVPTGDVGSTIFPEIGITSTPVIDPVSATIYVVAETKENGNYFHRLHALDLTTGAEKFGGPVPIQASVAGTGTDSVNGTISFVPQTHLQRPALTLYNGMVLIGFGSQGDNNTWHGWMLAYNAATLQQAWQFNVTPNGTAGAIWMAGGGFAVDAQGGIYFMSANGTFGTNQDYGDSFVRMTSAGVVADYFTPDTQSTMAADDLDLGAGGALILPDQPGAHPHLIVGAGKDTNIYLVDRDNMGKFNSQSNNQIVQELQSAFTGESRSQPAYWNGFVYFSAFGDPIKAYTISNGQLSTTPVSKTSVTFALNCDDFPSSGCSLSSPNPIVSSNGTTTGILWLVGLVGSQGTGTLYAFDATDLTRKLYDSTQAGSRDAVGKASKFTPVTVVNGKVYVAAQNQLLIYGLLPN